MLSFFISIFLLILSVFGLFLSTKLPFFDDPKVLFVMKSSFYPMIIFSGLLLSSFILLIKSILKFSKDKPLFKKEMLFILLFLILYVVALVYIKFIPSTLLFSFISGYYLLKDRSKKTLIKLAIVCVSITFVLYILFVEFFNIPL